MIEALLDSLWQGAFVVAVAAGITTFVPRRHAATRYAVWFVALLALALLPLIGQLVTGPPPSAIPISIARTTNAVSHVTEETSSAGGVWLAAFWATGLLVCAVRIAMSYLCLVRIRRSATPAPDAGERVFESPFLATPITAGLWQPVVIIPGDLIRALAPGDLEAVLAHERAHIARKDTLGNATQRVVEALLFFNPWVYLIGRQLVREREAACDDWAIRAGSDPRRFATCLATLALRSPRTQTTLLTPSAVWPERMLVGRIARLLDGKAIQVKTNYVIVTAAVALFAFLGLAFQSPRGLAADANCSSAATIVNAAQPEIPAAAVKAHPNAEVTLAVTVNASGRPSAIEIVKATGDPKIDVPVAHAAQHSTYKPEMRNCKAVSGGRYLFDVKLGPEPS